MKRFFLQKNALHVCVMNSQKRYGRASKEVRKGLVVNSPYIIVGSLQKSAKMGLSLNEKRQSNLGSLLIVAIT